MGQMEDAQEEMPALDPGEIESLRVTVATLGREVQALVEKVSGLTRAVESMTPTPPLSTSVGRRESTVTDDPGAREISLVVAPLPELAMAAVAETSLRGLESVRRVVAVKRTGDEARFALEIDPEGDLIEEMKGAMPVTFDVLSAGDDELVISLHWAWGRAE